MYVCIVCLHNHSVAWAIKMQTKQEIRIKNLYKIRDMAFQLVIVDS